MIAQPVGDLVAGLLLNLAHHSVMSRDGCLAHYLVMSRGGCLAHHSVKTRGGGTVSVIPWLMDLA